MVFGEVIDGYNIVEKVEQTPKDSSDKPKKPITIAKSGAL